MAQEPPWNPDDTGAVPVGPEPEPTGSGGGGAGPGGWGSEPRTEPFAVAALVWAVVSIVIPLIGTIIALVLAGRAADSIRRSQGTRKGDQLVLAARVVAGVVITLWAIGLVLFFALRSGDTNDKNNVAIPTQPSVSTTVPPPTSTTKPPVTTAPVTTLAPVTTAPVAPSTAIVPPPVTTAPPATTSAPATTTTPSPTTTTPPPPTTSPDQKQAAIIEERLLANPNLGPSNRGVPDNQRFVVQYTAGQPIVVTWAIDNGAAPLPSGPATCVPPTTTTTLTPPSSTTTSSTTSTTTTSTTTTTTTTLVPPSTTTLPGGVSTKDQARADAKQILRTLRTRRADINITDIVLMGTYPMSGNANAVVVKVTYGKAILNAPVTFPPATAFQVPPAQTLDCINPAFQ